jgi:Rrf2 family protein
MRVSAKSKYACIAMIELAASHAEPHPLRVKAIADAHNFKPRFLVQILLQLKTAGLVSSVRGASGGYHLARSPHEISLANVIDAIDPGAAPRPAAVITEQSPAERALSSVWQEAQERERRLLEEVTLAELVRRMQQDNALSYQI